MKLIVRLASLVALVCLLAPGAAAQLVAAVARVEITPPVGYRLGGYADRAGPSTGVHDPLYVTALLLRAGGVTAALLSCDLRSFPSPRVVSEARARRLADHVLIASTHTHSGPVTWEDKSWPAPSSSWFAATEEKILGAIASAAASLKPAQIAAGESEIYLGHNRRAVDAEGRVTMLWRNAERRPTAPLDPSLGVIRIDDEAGRPIAILVNYACHAVVLGPDNREISADYPGAMARRLEREFPGALCLFMQGGAGDINPYLDKQPVTAGGFKAAEEMGVQLAEAAAALARRLHPSKSARASIGAKAEVMVFRDRWDRGREVRAGLSALLINGEIAIVALPGEPFIELQIALRDKSEFPHTFLFGYTYSEGGEWVGYIPTLKAAVEGGYGAGYNTRLEVGAGEALIDRALAHLYTLLGRLKDLPDR